MTTLLNDVFYALRQMRKSPGFTLVAVITLALGIGANAAIFTLVHAILLRPLPVKDPSALYRIGDKDVNCCVTSGLQDVWDIYSYALYQQVKKQTPEFEDLAAFQAGLANVSTRRAGDKSPARPLHAEYVTGNYFSMLGLSPAAGRLLSPSDDRTESAPAAVMSYRAWQNYFASDPSILESSIALNGFHFAVVGIAPPDFYGDRLTDTPPDFWLPLALEPAARGSVSMLNQSNVHWLYVMGRLMAGASSEQVQSKITVELQQWLNSEEGTSTVGDNDRSKIAKQKVLMLPAAGGVAVLARETQKGLRLLMALSGLVLLIACANIANLLLARGAARKRQTAVRLALGARRLRLVRQLLTESILLAIIGGAVGLVVAYLGSRSILAIAFRGSEFIPIDPDPSKPVLLFSFLLSLLTGVVFGVAPAWITSHADPAEALRSGDRSSTHGASLAQKVLVVLQAALSLVLVAGAVLMVQSLRNLEHQNFGFQSDYRYIVRLGHAFVGQSPERLAGSYRDLEQRMSNLPGVITASYSMYSPMGLNNWSTSVYLPGRTHQSGEHGDYASWLRIGPNYFTTIGTRLLRGRTIGDQDTPNSTKVAVVNERFAKKFFKDQDPIGKRFGAGDPKHTADFEIVGVVEDAKYQDTHGQAYATYFLPYLQNVEYTDPSDISSQISSQQIETIELHVAGKPENLEGTVRRELAELDPDMTVIRITSFGEQVSEALNQGRLLARLTTLFGILALTLASIGLYGVTSYTVEQRTREIGIRVAVGANRSNVVAMVLGGAFRQVGIGLALGVPLAFLGGWLISSQLFEVKGYDPLALSLAVLLLAVCALVAGLVPARRAASIEPMQALRTE
ncbi:MAG TPA: ABC transporter permease [Terriglobales bacterium]